MGKLVILDPEKLKAHPEWTAVVYGSPGYINQVHDWCREHCECEFELLLTKVRFECDADAVMFKLMFKPDPDDQLIPYN